MNAKNRMWVAAAVVAGMVAAQGAMAQTFREYDEDLIHTNVSTQRGYAAPETALEPVDGGEIPGGGVVVGASARRGQASIEGPGRFEMPEPRLWFRATLSVILLNLGAW